MRGEFKLTERLRKRILRLLSNNDMLQISLKRTGKNTFKVRACCEGEAIFEMQTMTLKVSDEILINDIFTKVKMER